MKALVAIKKVVDYRVKIRIKADHSGVDTDNVKMSINPFDEIALEEAIRLKEKNIVNEIVVVSIGSDANQDIIRHALALGADRAILIRHNEALQPLQRAKLLKVIVEKEGPSLVFLGKQAIDDDCNQTGQMLASLLDWPQATFASAVEVGANQVVVTREIDEGLQTIAVTLPAVITADLRLNTPRLPTLPNIMKAKNKTTVTVDADTMGVDLQSKLRTVSVQLPPERKPGIKINSINELMHLLKEKHKVLK